MKPIHRSLQLLVYAIAVLTGAVGWAAQTELPSPIKQLWTLPDNPAHRDFPAMALDAKGTPWIAFIRHDGKNDLLRLAHKAANGIEAVVSISQPGIVHQPAIAIAGDGAIWCFWGQVDERDVVTLRARQYAGGQLDAEVTIAKSSASDTFADACTDQAGRVWVVWQSMRRGQGDIFTRWLDPKSGKWSQEIAVSKPEGGNWEPRVAFDGQDGAWIVFDSSRGDAFNLYLAHANLDGHVEEKHLVRSPEYQARASIAPGKDGKTLWIAAEHGRAEWGMQVRGHEPKLGINGEKRILFGRYNIAAGTFTEVAVPQQGKWAPRPAPVVNLPVIGMDVDGNPLLAWRYYFQTSWRIAVTRYDATTQTWSQPLEVPDSSFCQDRHAVFAHAGDTTWLCWPSDRRTTKEVLRANVFLAQLNGQWSPYQDPGVSVAAAPQPKPFLNAPTPPRPRDEHHTWEIGGKKYMLVFGDLHRHTDFSNCITQHDGCTLEHFRYAIDVAALDFVGTSDHTDIAKIYDPYEWWQTQRTVDVFYVPGQFNSLYAYEREQTQPWGHRNVVFAQRGGPIVYIQRKHYLASQWDALYPVKVDGGQITPMELWDVLDKYGQPVAVISHTGATNMGTDWDRYQSIDGKVENTVEIYQGARVSYEGLGTPQPTVGMRVNEPYNHIKRAGLPAGAAVVKPPEPIKDFGKPYDNGVYQHALADGFKLGVFASSDHISTHTAFGGVYVEANTRLGIIEGLRTRHSIAATDKIFVEFSCNDKPMGEVFSTSSRPELKFAVEGTASIKRITLVRNEADYKVWEPGNTRFADTFTDTAPLDGENRYYLRVEQADGNMAWSSPVWVTIKK
jgi:hypothetical protein